MAIATNLNNSIQFEPIPVDEEGERLSYSDFVSAMCPNKESHDERIGFTFAINKKGLTLANISHALLDLIHNTTDVSTDFLASIYLAILAHAKLTKINPNFGQELTGLLIDHENNTLWYGMNKFDLSKHLDCNQVKFANQAMSDLVPSIEYMKNVLGVTTANLQNNSSSTDNEIQKIFNLESERLNRLLSALKSQDAEHDASSDYDNLDNQIIAHMTTKQCEEEKLLSAEADRLQELLQQLDQNPGESLLFSILREGAIVEGEVKAITTSGAFINLGAFDALLRISEISWSRSENSGKNLHEILRVGQLIRAVVSYIEPKERKIHLSLKRLEPNPYKQLNPNDIVRVKITKVVKYGAYVQVDETPVESLIHISELSPQWVTDPSEVVQEGEMYSAKIIKVDAEKEKLKLSMRQLELDKYEELIGQTVRVTVTDIVDYGAYVTVSGQRMKGLIHISKMSSDWVSSPQDLVQIGKDYDAQVISISPKRSRIELSMNEADLVIKEAEDILGELAIKPVHAHSM